MRWDMWIAAMAMSLFVVFGTAFCYSAKADYRLDVWELSVPKSQPPLATKPYIALSDCMTEGDWVMRLLEKLGIKAYATCQEI